MLRASCPKSISSTTRPGKPVGIQQLIGRRPIAAFGNSDGDLEMLEWTTAGAGVRFALFVHHNDAAREWAYDRAVKHRQLDKGLDEARGRGWTVVSMKDDWKTVFPAASTGNRRSLRTSTRLVFLFLYPFAGNDGYSLRSCRYSGD